MLSLFFATRKLRRNAAELNRPVIVRLELSKLPPQPDPLLTVNNFIATVHSLIVFTILTPVVFTLKINQEHICYV